MLDIPCFHGNVQQFLMLIVFHGLEPIVFSPTIVIPPSWTSPLLHLYIVLKMHCGFHTVHDLAEWFDILRVYTFLQLTVSRETNEAIY